MSIPQSEIPRLSILYHAKRLIPSNKPPQRTPSAALNTRVGLIRSDITKLSLPNGAIVNTTNTSLLNAGGLCGAIHNAAGRGLLEECLTLNGCETGDAKITGAYELACRNVIHAVGPVYWKARKTNEHASLLASCYTASLRLAVENGLEVIAFPAISGGVFGYPSYEAAEVAISTVRDFLERGEQESGAEGRRLRLVVFCTSESKDEIAYIELLPNYFPLADDKEDSRKSPEHRSLEEVKTSFSPSSPSFSSFSSAPSSFAAATFPKDTLRISPKPRETPGPQDPNRHRYHHNHQQQQQQQQNIASAPDGHDDVGGFVLVTSDHYQH